MTRRKLLIKLFPSAFYLCLLFSIFFTNVLYAETDNSVYNIATPPIVLSEQDGISTITVAFSFPEELPDPGGISIRSVRWPQKVTLNGKTLYTNPEPDGSYLFVPLNLPLVEDDLQEENILAIRLYSFQGEYTGISDSIVLLSQNTFIRSSRKDLLVYRLLPFGFAMALLFLLVHLLIFSIISPFSKKLSGSVLLIALFLFTLLHLYVPYPLSFSIRIDQINLLSIPILAMFTLLFCQGLFSFYNRTINFRVLIIFFLSFLIKTIIPVFCNRALPGPYLGIMEIIIFIAAASFYLYTIPPKKEGHPYPASIIICLLSLFIMVSKQLSDQYGLIQFNLLMPYGLFIFFIIAAALFISTLHRDRQRLQKIYLRLTGNSYSEATEDYVSEGTRERIQEIETFIKNNYTNDLSREGIAYSTGVSPNYMSQSFFRLTGMKINDYIHSLRISKACSLLRESDTNIIDIAYSVGYSSLTTFNRIFKKETGISPREYRKKESSTDQK